VIALLHLLILQWLMAKANLTLPMENLWITGKLYLMTFLPPMVGAVVLGTVYSAFRGRGKAYLKRIFSMEWIVMTVRVLILSTLVSHTYCWLKLLIPLLNSASFDARLWNIDTVMGFGLSPNVFFLHLFSYPPVLKGLDALYINVFSITLLIGNAIFTALPSTRVRMAYATGSGYLWLVGGWLYLLMPSLGPCYAYPHVWESFTTFLPRSVVLQKALLDNYNRILGIPGGTIDAGIVLVHGIAAFPSLHVASQTFIAFWVRRYSLTLGFVLMVSVGLLWLGSIVTGWHYMVDSIVGLFLGWACFAVVWKTFKIPRWKRLISIL